MKYIIIEDTAGVEVAILFPSTLTHQSVASGIAVEYPQALKRSYVVAAGECSISQRDDGRFESEAWGGFEAKDIHSRPEDAFIIQQSLMK